MSTLCPIKYQTSFNKKTTKEYALWVSMLGRIYPKSENQQQKYKSYKDHSVSENFKNFQYFAHWCNSQIGFHYAKCRPLSGPRWELDKDILIKNNKEYSENTCVFIPRSLNLMIVNNSSIRGEFPIGVSFAKDCKKKPFTANCSAYGIEKRLGHYTTSNEAFLCYKSFKEEHVKEVATFWESRIDPRVYKALMSYTVEITD